MNKGYIVVCQHCARKQRWLPRINPVYMRKRVRKCVYCGRSFTIKFWKLSDKNKIVSVDELMARE